MDRFFINTSTALAMLALLAAPSFAASKAYVPSTGETYASSTSKAYTSAISKAYVPSTSTERLATAKEDFLVRHPYANVMEKGVRTQMR